MRIIGVAWIFAALTTGQVPESGWEVLSHSAGQKVEIVLKDGPKIRGKLDTASGRDLTIAGKRFLKEQVAEVYAVDRGSRWKGAAIGAAIGFGAGFGWLAAMKASNGDWAWSDGFELFGPLGVAVGTPAGYFLSGRDKGKRIIYRAP